MASTRDTRSGGRSYDDRRLPSDGTDSCSFYAAVRLDWSYGRGTESATNY